MAAAVGVALLLQLVAVARSPLIAPDGIEFIRFARELGGDPVDAIRSHAQHPGYPLLIRFTHVLTGSLIPGDAGWEFAARMACGASGLACVALIWLLVRDTLGVAAANVAALIFAVLPIARQNAADALSDPSHLMFYLCAVWLVCRWAARRSWWQLLLAGVASGLAFWVRPEGLSAAVMCAGALLVVPALRAAAGGARRAWLGSAALLAGAAIVAAPLVLVSGKLTGKLAGKPGWQQLQAPVAPTEVMIAKFLELQRLQPAATPAPVIPVEGNPKPWGGSPTSIVLGGISQLGTALAEVLSGVLLVPLLVGIPIALRRMPRSACWTCLILSVTQIGMLLTLYWLGGYISRRHLHPLVALLIASSGLRTLAIVHRLNEFGRQRFNARWLGPGVAVLVLSLLIPRAIRPLHQSHLHKLQAVEWLRAHGQQGDVVGSNAVEIVYRATMDGRIRPGSSLRPGLPIDADGPLLQNTHLVVSVDSANQLPEWTAGIPTAFTPVTRIIGDSKLRQRDLVIYRRGDILQTAAESPPLNSVR